jgi:ribonuclease HI
MNRDGVETRAAGTVPQTTNQQMELSAAIEALSVLPEPSEVEITSDAQYIVNGITGWIHGWKRNGWRNAHKKPVENRALWEELDRPCQIHRVTWCWVPGHSGDFANERCDVLAYRQAGIPVNELPPWW